MTKCHYIILLFMLCSMSVAAQAIRQQGYVRTVGRPGKTQGTPVRGVLVQVSGQHNKVLSDRNGHFTLIFNGKKEGSDAFSFSSIRMAGYDLQEREVIGRRYVISSTTPVEIVLVPQSLKIEMEKKIRQQIEKNYQEKLNHLQTQKNKLGRQYEQKLAELEAQYDRRDQLVADMVERYASTDYAHLTPFAAKLNSFIEAGELERADSLIRTVNIGQLLSDHATLKARGERYRAAITRNDSAKVSAQRQMMIYYKTQAEKFAHLEQADSALHYTEAFVDVDSSRIDHMLEAASWLALYFPSQSFHKPYLKRALLAAELKERECRENIKTYETCMKRAELQVAREALAKVLKEKGEALQALHQEPEALECYRQAIEIYKKSEGKHTEEIEWLENKVHSIKQAMY